jgi:hypothetical protein
MKDLKRKVDLVKSTIDRLYAFQASKAGSYAKLAVIGLRI